MLYEVNLNSHEMYTGGLFYCEKNPALKTLFWILIILGILSYVWSFTAISFSLWYPSRSRIVVASWIWHAASMILLMWMPTCYFLIYFRKTSIVFPIVFITGCIVAIFLTFGAVIYLGKYLKTDSIKNEFLEELKTYLETKNDFPTWAKYKDCCGWDGPTDLGLSFLGKDKEFQKTLKECYKNENVTLIENQFRIEHPENITVKGCKKILEPWVQQQHEVISTSALIIIPAGLATIAVYLFHYFQLLKEKDNSSYAPTEKVLGPGGESDGPPDEYERLSSIFKIEKSLVQSNPSRSQLRSIPKIYITSPSPSLSSTMGGFNRPRRSRSRSRQSLSRSRSFLPPFNPPNGPTGITINNLHSHEGEFLPHPLSLQSTESEPRPDLTLVEEPDKKNLD